MMNESTNPAVVVVVVFDADNTLYPTRRAAKAGYNALYAHILKRTLIPEKRLRAKHACIIRSIKESRSPVKRSKEHSVRILIAEVLGKKRNDPAVHAMTSDSMRAFWNAVVNTLRLNAASRRVVETLSRNGFRMIIASDEFEKPLRMKLEKTLGKRTLKSSIGLLITPERTGVMKPSGKYCALAFRAFNTVPHHNFVFVGDSWERDLKAAKASGAVTVLVSAGSGGNGGGNPDYCIKSLRNLPKTLKKMSLA